MKVRLLLINISIIILSVFLYSECLFAAGEEYTDLYVDCTRPPGGDGHSWTTAYKYLQDAIAAITTEDTIHVAKGTYRPDQGNGITLGDRSASFKLKNRIDIIGGYAGYGAADYFERNVAVYKTILSGDLNGDDQPDFTNYSDNSYNVVTCDGITSYTALAGFTITGGNAEGPYPSSRGGGILIINSGQLKVMDCIFYRNMAQHAGGGMYSMSGSSPSVINCLFVGNRAQNVGGGMQDAGSSSTLLHCTFYGNEAIESPGWGGGIRIYASNTTLINCILWGNSAANGNQIALDTGSTLNISHCDVQGGQSAIYKPDASTIIWDTGNINANPLFVDADNGDFHLQVGSPCIDAGTAETYIVPSDLEGNDRYDDPNTINTGSGFANYFDIGAFEYHAIRALVREYYLDILDREPDRGGWDYWASEIKRIKNLGINVGEGFQAEARLFFNSQEYLSKNKTATQFVTDLYQTFLQREPDAEGLTYWVGELSCLTRNMLITQFAYSAEFKAYLTSLFGVDVTRPENNMVNDFYRGILGRLPDNAGFNAWVGQMRTAQCTGAQAVEDLSYQLSLLFVQSAEYTAKGRNNEGYIEDLYNAILRRGADCGGFTVWVDNLDSMTRAQVLQAFTASTEFQTRVEAVIAAGCLP